MSKPESTPVNRHKIRFINPIEIECAIRAEMGFTTKSIAAVTGLSEGQTQYRISKAKIKRRDYRSGESYYAKMALKSMHPYLAKHVSRDIAPRFK